MTKNFLTFFSRFKVIFLIFLSVCLSTCGNRESIKKGNQYYSQGKYEQAVGEYQKCKDSPIARYNLGGAFYKQRDYDKAIEKYHTILAVDDKEIRQKAYYNLGNAQFRIGDLNSAIESYKNALRITPNDWDAKHNLEFALRELERIRQNIRKQNDADKNKQEKKESTQAKEKSQEQKMSKEDVKRVLNVIRREEKELQKSLLRRKLLKAQTDTLKDW